MPWKCDFTKDHDKETVGTVTARFVDENENEVFNISKRLDGNNSEDVAALVKAAKEKMGACESDAVKNNTIAAGIEEQFNKVAEPEKK